MWQLQSKDLIPGKTIEYKISQGDKTLSYDDFLNLLAANPEFRTYFNQQLSSSPFPAFRWETPGICKFSVNKDFSYVTVNSPGLKRDADRRSFKEHFVQKDNVVAVPNLGGDALMIIPTLASTGGDYVHLAEFVNSAPADAVDLLWRTVGEEMTKRLGSKKCWLSTAGAGVAWLHVRIDSRPKYYSHSAYRI